MTDERDDAEKEAEREQHRRSNRGVRWIVLGVVLLTLLLVLGGGVGVLTKLFATGDAGLSRRVMAFVNGALSSDSTRFDCDRISGTLFRGAILERPRLLVRTATGEVTWASARSAHVDYDLWRLLVTRQRDLTVTLDSLRVTLARNQSGALVMPKFRKGSGKRGKSETRVRITLQRSTLELVAEKVSVLDISATGNMTSGPTGSSLLVERLEGSLRSGGKAAPLRLDGMAAFQDSVWRLDPVRIELAATRLAASGDWDPRRGRLREGTLHLNPLVLEEVLPLGDVTGVEGTLRGDVEIEGTLGDGAASGCLSGSIEGEAIDTLLVRARLTPHGVLVDHLQTRLRGATVTGTGRIDRSGGLEADLEFSGANPASIPWWKDSEGMPSGTLAGTARLRISRGKPRPSIRVETTLGRSRIGRLPIERANFLVHAPPQGGFLVDSLSLSTPGARIVGSGSIGAEGALRASATAAVTDLGAMKEILAPAVLRDGSGRVAATFGGTTKAPTIDLHGVLVRPRFESGLRAESLIVDASGALSPAIDVTGTLRVASLAAKDRALGNVSAAFQGGRELFVRRFEQSAGDTSLTLHGLLTFEKSGVTARVDSLRLRAGALEAVAAKSVGVTFAKGRLQAAPLAFDLRPGRVEADLDWDLKAGRIDLRGAVEGLDLARLGADRAGREAEGLLHAQFLAAGPVSDPDVTIRGTLDSPRWRGLAADSVEARLDYSPGVLRVESLRWDLGTTSAQVMGSLRTSFTLESWIRSLSRGDRSWADQITLALEASADSFDLAAIAPADTTLRTLQGAASFHARIGGSFASPVLSFSGRVPGLRFHSLQGDVAALEGSYRDRRLSLERLELRQDKGTMNASGTMPIDLSPFARTRVLREDPLQLTLRADETDFSALTSLTTLVTASSGRLSGEAEVTGTPAHPRWTGSVRLRDGRLRIAGRYEVVEAITVDGTFDEERLTLTKIEARQGKRGRVSGQGWWLWSGAGKPLPPGSVGPPGEYTVTLKATDFVVTDREYYLFQFNGNFTIVSGRTELGIVKPLITGTGSVSRGELAFNLSAPPGEPPAPLPFLYDVTADFPRQFKYRQLDTEVDLAGTLRLRNEGERDVALGVLTVKGGQFYFLTRKFGDLTGEVNFNNLDRLDPFVTLDAQTRVRRGGGGGAAAGGEGAPDHIIKLAVTGRSSQLQIRPWDDDGTSPSDLWRELSVGQFSSAERGATDTGRDPQSGVGFSLPIRDYLFRNAERWIAGSGFIDTIDLQSGNRSGTKEGAVAGAIDLGLVGVGKYVTRDLFLKYSSDFTGQSEKQITAEYRVTRHLLLRGQQIQRRQTGAQAAQEYNLDLKIRVEY